MKLLTVSIQGIAPLIPHNGQLANPLFYYSREIKKISQLRNKTEEHYAKLASNEWWGSLYVNKRNEDGSIPKDAKLNIPSHCLEATLINAAKTRKKGNQAKAGLRCHDSEPFDKLPCAGELAGKSEYILSKLVNVQKAKIIRTRPILKEWSLSFVLEFEEKSLNRDDIDSMLKTAGEQIGLLDERPRYGRFRIIEIKENK